MRNAQCMAFIDTTITLFLSEHICNPASIWVTSLFYHAALK